MKTENLTGNEPAYPLAPTSNENGIYSIYDSNGGKDLGGLTIRQHYAGLAMQGLCSTYLESQQIILAEHAVMVADRLIDALNKPQAESAYNNLLAVNSELLSALEWSAEQFWAGYTDEKYRDTFRKDFPNHGIIKVETAITNAKKSNS